MNNFVNLADKLINTKFWSSKATLIQLVQAKDSSNRVIYRDDQSATLNCVKKDLERKIANDLFESNTAFYFSMKALKNFDLSKKFAIEYNGKRFYVEDIQRLGTTKNEDAVVKMVVKR